MSRAKMKRSDFETLFSSYHNIYGNKSAQAYRFLEAIREDLRMRDEELVPLKFSAKKYAKTIFQTAPSNLQASYEQFLSKYINPAIRAIYIIGETDFNFSFSFEKGEILIRFKEPSADADRYRFIFLSLSGKDQVMLKEKFCEQLPEHVDDYFRSAFSSLGKDSALSTPPGSKNALVSSGLPESSKLHEKAGDLLLSENFGNIVAFKNNWQIITGEWGIVNNELRILRFDSAKDDNEILSTAIFSDFTLEVNLVVIKTCVGIILRASENAKDAYMMQVHAFGQKLRKHMKKDFDYKEEILEIAHIKAHEGRELNLKFDCRGRFITTYIDGLKIDKWDAWKRMKLEQGRIGFRLSSIQGIERENAIIKSVKVWR